MKQIKHYWPGVCIATFCTYALMVSSAGAQNFDQTLTGDWGGERTRLYEEGYQFSATLQSQSLSNLSGGSWQTTASTQQLMLMTALDLDKIWNWHGATFTVMVTDRKGRNIDTVANIPAFEQQQLIWGRGQTWWLTQMALQQTLFDGKIVLHVGRLTPDFDFDTLPCDFQNITFCGGPPANLVGGQYWYNWPSSQWGGVVTYNYSPTAWVKLGAYQNNPDYLDNEWTRANAWKPWRTGRSDGALMPVEFGWAPKVAGLPGKYMVGAWIVTKDGNDIYLNTDHRSLAEYGGEALEGQSRYGGYVSLLQQVTGDADHGLSLNLNFTAADKNTTYLDRETTFMAEYRGPFGRSQDIVGLGLGATQANPRFARYMQELAAQSGSRSTVGYGYEYTSELFYNWVPYAGVNVRPNLQYIVHPGGSSRNDNSFGVGLNLLLVF